MQLSNPYVLWTGITLVVYLALYGLKKLLTTRVSGFFKHTSNKWDDIIVHTMEQTTQLWMVFTAMFVALRFVAHDRNWDHYINQGYFILTMVQLCIWANYLIDKWIVLTINKKTRQSPAAAGSIGLIQILSKIFILSAILLFTLHNLGIKITTILAGLGVGGIAVALALQRILGDLFSSLSIVMDKPFVVGDFIVMDTFMGDVERIGLKTTRIRSIGGEQIIISNSDLIAARIRNYQRMQERRVLIQLSLDVGTKGEDMRKAVSLIQAIVHSKEKARLDRCHFMSISKISMDIECVYYALTDDTVVHMDLQQDILLDIQRAFEAEKLLFARPFQNVSVEPREFIMRTQPEPLVEAERRRTIV
jgi:small-conductance mechanosensitive channel